MLTAASPKDISDVQKYLDMCKSNKNIITNKGEIFLVKNDAGTNIILFSCKNNLKSLIEHYKHLAHLTIAASSAWNSLQTYVTVLKYLEEQCDNFAPIYVTVDFEVAIHKANRHYY